MKEFKQQNHACIVYYKGKYTHFAFLKYHSAKYVHETCQKYVSAGWKSDQRQGLNARGGNS